VGGVTTFLAVVYIVVVNPSILATEGTGMAFSGVMTATVLVCSLLTLFMGLYAKLPFAVAPGMGLNAFFTFTLVLGQGIPWPVALGIVFWAGVLFLVLSVTPVREAIVRAIPRHLQIAMAGGIGLFLTFIGLQQAGLVVSSPVTLVRPGALGVESLLALTGLAVMVLLIRRGNPLAYLAGMGVVTAVGWALGRVALPDELVAPPDFTSVLLQADLVGALHLALVPPILAFLFTDLFDSLSTLIGVSHATGLLDADGHPRNLRQGLIVDAFATLGAGLAGSSSGTAYIESAAGINAGGRSGRAAVVTALCFLPCFFLSPLAGAVPRYATAPVLLLVGWMMFRSVQRLDFARIEDALPAYLTIVLIPLTFSITQGILWGFITHAVLYLFAGRRHEVHPMMFGLAASSAILLAIEARMRMG
jgi:AGZA family xanthine/uracil permease-like MFS transporter